MNLVTDSFPSHSMEPPRKCLVCYALTPCTHLGIEACRACASFFKRAKLMKRKYVCRQGNGKCRTAKNERFICRKCRLDRCVSVGMKMKEDEADNEQAPLSEQSASTPTDNTIQRIGRAYKKYCDERRVNEQSLRISNKYPERLIEVPGSTELKHVTCMNFDTDIAPVASVDFIKFLSETFPEFGSLSRKDKNVVFKNGQGRLWMVETYKLAAEYWPGGIPEYFPVGMTALFDFTSCEGYLPSGMDEKKKEDIYRNIKYYSARNINLIHPMLSKAQLNETEYNALVGISIWSFHSSKDAPEHLVEISEKIRKDIFTDLGRYYRDKQRLSNYATRIGEMMSLAHAIDEAVSLLYEEFRTYRLYDLVADDSYWVKTWD